MLAYHTLFNIVLYICLSQMVFVMCVAPPNVLTYHNLLVIALHISLSYTLSVTLVAQDSYHSYWHPIHDLMLDIFEWWHENCDEEHQEMIVEPQLAIQISYKTGNNLVFHHASTRQAYRVPPHLEIIYTSDTIYELEGMEGMINGFGRLMDTWA